MGLAVVAIVAAVMGWTAVVMVVAVMSWGRQGATLRSCGGHMAGSTK